MDLGWIMGVFLANKILKTCRSRKISLHIFYAIEKIREKGKSEGENWFLALPFNSFCFVDE